jgi:hypothetical protein
VSDATYAAIAEWSQIVAAILFVIALVVIWNKYLAPAVLASQARKNAELAEAEQRRDAARAEVEKAQAESAAAESDVGAVHRAHRATRRVSTTRFSPTRGPKASMRCSARKANSSVRARPPVRNFAPI